MNSMCALKSPGDQSLTAQSPEPLGACIMRMYFMAFSCGVWRRRGRLHWKVGAGGGFSTRGVGRGASARASSPLTVRRQRHVDDEALARLERDDDRARAVA